MKKIQIQNLQYAVVFIVLFLSVYACQTGEYDFSKFVSEIGSDKKIPVTSGKASSTQWNGDIELSFDGNSKTHYHSLWDNESANYFPITLDYFFNGNDTINYMVYNPRSDGNINGNFREVEVWIQPDSGVSYKYGDFDFVGRSTPSSIDFTPALVGAKSIRIIVKSGTGDGQGFASCAEMEFFKINPQSFDLKEIFTDESCSELQKNVSRSSINKIDNLFLRKLAHYVADGKANDEFRLQEYTAYTAPGIMAQKNKTASYGLWDNPTGIVARRGEIIIVCVGETENEKPVLFIQSPNFGFSIPPSATYYGLHSGINKIKAKSEGLMYISYYTTSGTEKPVKIQILTGQVSGYFDTEKHPAEEWEPRLAQACYPHFDVKGKYATLNFDTEAFRTYVKDPRTLSRKFDDVVRREQVFMGLVKYNRQPKNRLHFQVAKLPDWVGAYASDNYTGFGDNGQQILSPEISNHDAMIGHLWGIVHEVGHIHQTRPGLRWYGTVEVTNNIFSLDVTTNLGFPSRLFAESISVGKSTAGYARENNRYQKAYQDIIESKIAHAACEDVFCKLVPFWQLKLYMHNVLGKEDFYADVY
ncbi:MAG: M60 family metallopeptidase, partial [Dysgonamonadaceae bacterium]|nr:M60 family metallopeptidase [Dysgonamonadaceae bacterium]